jgi:hypothetical protein
MARKVLPPVHKSGETLAAVQVQTTTNNTLRQAKFSA